MAKTDTYWGYPLGMTREQVNEAYYARFHEYPAEITSDGTMWKAGPTPKPAYTDPVWLADLDAPTGRRGRRVA